MSNENNILDKFSQEKAQQFADILREAIESYVKSINVQPLNEWLNGYLTARMPNKNADEIAKITADIIETINQHEEKLSSMKKAVSEGQAVENWFAKETLSPDIPVGEQAKELVECHAALTEISNTYESPENYEEVIEVDVIPPEEWEDSNWNKYKMKDMLVETAKQAGTVAIKNTASDLYEKVTEYGFKTVLTDKTLVNESVLYGASTGLKAATSGAMQVASEVGVLPDVNTEPVPLKLKTVIASLAIENVKILSGVAKGDIDISDGLAMIKNNTVATVSSMIGHKYGVSIGAAIGSVVGPLGTMVGGFVGGAIGKFAGTKVGSAIVSAGKKICSGAKAVVKSVGRTIKSAASKVVSFFRGW